MLLTTRACGWFSATSRGATTTPSAANSTAYAEIVRDKAIQRKLIDVGTGIVNDGFQPEGRDGSELLAKAEQDVFAIAEGHSRGRQDFTPVRTALIEAFDVLRRYSQDKNVKLREVARMICERGGLT